MKQTTSFQPATLFWLRVLAIVALTVTVYSPALTAGFLWDDDSVLTANALVKSSRGLWDIWFSTQLPDYFPLTSTSLWLEWRAWGDWAGGYHATNILLHAISSILLWRVLVRLEIPGAFVAAVLFAVHPVNVESVAWITERKNTLSLVFFLLAALFFFRSLGGEFSKREKGGSERQRTFYIWSVGLFLLSLLSKTAGVMLPCALLLCVWWKKGNILRADIIRSLPFFGLAIFFGSITVWFQYHRAIADDLVPAHTLLEKGIIAGRASWFYLGKALLPLNLSFVYPMWKLDDSAALSYLPTIALVAIFLFLLMTRVRRTRSLILALGYFVLMLLPVLGFFKIYFQRYSLVADHWQYFALIGIVSVVAVGMDRMQRFGVLVYRSIVVLIVVVLSILSWRQCAIYQNAEVLWRDTLAKNPSAWLAHNELGLLLNQQGKAEEAMTHYQQSLKLQPEQVEAYNNAGTYYLVRGQLEVAMGLFHQALQSGPRSAVTHYNIGNVLDRQKKSAEATREYLEALRLDPAHADAENNLACMLATQGKVSEAIERFKHVIDLQPKHFDALNNLGTTLVESGKAEEAIPYLRRAVELVPDFADGHYNLGNAFSAVKRHEEARGEYNAAIKAKPDMSLAYYKLGNLYFHENKVELAVREYEAALNIQPNLAEAHYQLGLVLQTRQQTGEAIAHLKRAVELKPDWTEALNNLAWIYATHSNALFRDGDEAIRLAKHAAELTFYKDAAILDTLAAGYAQNHEFEAAVSTLERAFGIIDSKSGELYLQLQHHMVIYKARKPFRQ